MKALLEKAGASFLRAFGASLLILAPGVLAAPDLNQSKLLAVAAVISAFTAGLRALQVFVPSLSFDSLLPTAYAWAAKYLDSFARAFVGTAITLLLGVFTAPDLATAKGLLTGVLVGALAAGLRAVQSFFTAGEDPAPNVGLDPNKGS